MTDGEADEQDIDAIELHSIEPMPAEASLYGRGATQVFVPSKSTPLEEDAADEQIPAPALWAMKYRRHLRFGRRDDDYFRSILGDGRDPVYVLDDGATHYMICREVGEDGAGLTYYLIGRISLNVYWDFAEDVAGIFSEADDLALCSVYEAPGAVSNVLVVEAYGGVDDVPPEYLPAHPQVQFPDDLGGEWEQRPPER